VDDRAEPHGDGGAGDAQQSVPRASSAFPGSPAIRYGPGIRGR
jgi:hypothetical protein